MNARNDSQRGFTLVEILVSLMVLAVLITLAYRAFDGILLIEERSKSDFLQENRRQLAMAVLLNDFMHLRPRTTRDVLGGVDPAYQTPAGDYEVIFTRGGQPDFAGMEGGLQRVAYQVRDGQLLRVYWRVTDLAPNTQVEEQRLTEGVESLSVEQLNPDGDWSDVWPPLNTAVPDDALPRLVRLTLVYLDGTQTELLVPGVEQSPGALQ